MKTEISWISTDDRLPEPGAHIIALAPLMGMFGKQDELVLIECRVKQDGYGLLDIENEDSPWETDSLMWWAYCPDWMASPGWRVS